MAQGPRKSTEDAAPRGTAAANLLFAAAASVALGVVSYAIAVTTAVESSLGLILTAIGVVCGAFLILIGFLAPQDSSSGLVANALKLLPAMSAWARRSPARLAVSIALLIAAAAASYWVGPAGIRQVSVACDDANGIKLAADRPKANCKSVFDGKIWRWPQDRTQTLTVTCLDAKDNGWNVSLDAGGKGKCGARPQNPRYVTNGITPPRLDLETVSGRRTFKHLNLLKQELNKEIDVDRAVKDRLLLATWNLREFGRRDRRLDESYTYIADIISHFDIVALQEIMRRDALDRIIKLLGPDYKLALSFPSPGICGQRERLAFVYDARKVKLNGIASNVVIMSNPDKKESTTATDSPTTVRKSQTGQPCRPPFFAEFDIFGRKLTILTFHIIWGRARAGPPSDRLREITDIFSYIGDVLKRDSNNKPLVVAGDLQAKDADGPEIKILEELGYQFDPELKKAGSNAATNRPYDQIALLPGKNVKVKFGVGGVFDFNRTVFRDQDADAYKVEVTRGRNANRGAAFDWRRYYLRFWRTYQMSDHFPKWIALRLE